MKSARFRYVTHPREISQWPNRRPPTRFVEHNPWPDRLRLIQQAVVAVLAVLLISTFAAIVCLDSGCRI